MPRVYASPGPIYEPEGSGNDDLYRYLAAEFDTMDLAYLHLLFVRGEDPLLAELRGLFRGTLVLNRPGRQRHRIGADVAAGLADIEALGVLALANPDLVERLKVDAPLNEVRPALFYAGGGAEGYIDYPTLDAA